MCWLSMLLSDDAWDNRSHLFTLHTMAANERSLVLSNQIPIIDKKSIPIHAEMVFFFVSIMNIIFQCNLQECQKLSYKRTVLLKSLNI